MPCKYDVMVWLKQLIDMGISEYMLRDIPESVRCISLHRHALEKEYCEIVEYVRTNKVHAAKCRIDKAVVLNYWK